MKFRPCIDLHNGKVKQIVGSTLNDTRNTSPVTNYISDQPASWYAKLYKNDKLSDGHVIRLGEGNSEVAREILGTWPEGLRIGGGITNQNAKQWLDYGASAVIVTSYVFRNGEIYYEGLEKLTNIIGKDHLVLDLSCRKREGKYWIVTNRWQKFTNVPVTIETLDCFSRYCTEFLVHAVDAEGKCNGIEHELVTLLGQWRKIPVTYAGGIRSWKDIKLIKEVGNNAIDFTVGSALDLFGGQKLQYKDLVSHHKNRFRSL